MFYEPWIVAALITVGLLVPSGQVQAATMSDADIRCATLRTADFSMLQDAPTQIAETALVAAVGKDPAYCRVRGYIAPQVGFELRLPSNWNHKFIEIGCGGDCGTLEWALWCPLPRGYACIVTDMGHKGGSGLWAHDNLQAEIDFGYRATHVTALAGKAIVASFYGEPASKSMLMGCSTGGYQGMVEAQRFPWDFNGIIAIAPDMGGQADLGMRSAWHIRNIFGEDGNAVLSVAQLQLLHQAALAKCDMTDGVRDGIVGDPSGCHFDPGVLACKAGQTASCLNPQQITAVRNIYSGPMSSKGEHVSTRGAFPGSELNWSEASGTYDQNWATIFFRNMFTFGSTGQSWKIADFDFDRDYERLGLADIYSDNNPDLRKFKASGGKLIVAQGGNDSAEIPGALFDYYETVKRTMSDSGDTRSFFRLFTVPGMNHCTGGDGAFAVDYLSYLETWVERGQPPEKMIGAHVESAYLIQSAQQSNPDVPPTSLTPEMWTERGAFLLRFPLDPAAPVAFTRPLYPYPLHAMYTGRGDPKDAANFTAVGPNLDSEH
jgi:Tannase and feruloyl esterase